MAIYAWALLATKGRKSPLSVLVLFPLRVFALFSIGFAMEAAWRILTGGSA